MNTNGEHRKPSASDLVVLVHNSEEIRAMVTDAAHQLGAECIHEREPGEQLRAHVKGHAACILFECRPADGALCPVVPFVLDGADAPVVSLVSTPEPSRATALPPGVWSALRTPCTSGELSEAIGDALAEARRRIADSHLVDRFRRDTRQLTRDEREVMEAVCEGKLNKQIAREFGISVRTVEQRRRRVFAKMGVASAVPLASKLATVRTLERLRPRLRRDPGSR